MDSLLNLWHLDGHGPYVWGSYGLALLAMVLETALARRRHRRALGATATAPADAWHEESPAP